MNRLTVELGAWYFKHLRQLRIILTLPWKGLIGPEAGPEAPSVMGRLEPANSKPCSTRAR